jgi:uncharacterized ferredoxin-like protein
MLLLNESIETPRLKSAAESICLVARTAPKRKGKIMMFIALVTDDDKCWLQDRMRLIGERDNVPSILA